MFLALYDGSVSQCSVLLSALLVSELYLAFLALVAVYQPYMNAI